MGAQDQTKFHKGILEKHGGLCEFASAPCTGLCKSSNFTTYAVAPALSMLLRLILRWEEILISSHQLLFLIFFVHIDVHITMHLTEKE